MLVVSDTGIFITLDAAKTWKKAADYPQAAMGKKYDQNATHMHFGWDPIHNVIYVSIGAGWDPVSRMARGRAPRQRERGGDCRSNDGLPASRVQGAGKTINSLMTVTQ